MPVFPNLQRITTEYIDTEDRIRLVGELAAGEVVTLWLTQRLLNRLVSHLCGWLGGQAGNAPLAEMRQEMAQEKARLELELQAPVRAEVEAPSVLVYSVDVTVTKVGVVLLFKDAGPREVARLQLGKKPLRQWLGIVHGQYQKARWSIDVWPAWVEEAQHARAHSRSVVLH